MIVKRVAVILVSASAFFLFSAGDIHAQLSAGPSFPEELRNCTKWRSVPGDVKGTRRWVFPYLIGVDSSYNPSKEYEGRGTLPAGKSGTVEKQGLFVSPTPMYIGMLSGPNDVEETSQFVTPFSSTIDFYSDLAPKTPVRLQGGSIPRFQHRPINRVDPAVYGISCRQGEAPDRLENVPAPSGFSSSGLPAAESAADPPESSDSAPKPPAGIPENKKIGDLFPKGPSGSPEKSDRKTATREAPPNRGGLAAVMSGKPASTKPETVPPALTPLNIKPSLMEGESPSAEGAEPPGLKQVMTPEAKEPVGSPSSERAPQPGSVCNTQTGEVKWTDVKLASLQAVAIRNGDSDANGFEYLASTGDAISLNRKVDVSQTAKKIISYEDVAPAHAGVSKALWVSIPGTEQTRNKPADSASSRPGKTLRIIVASGATELAISGLDQLDPQLRSAGKDRIGLNIEWQIIDQSGTIKPAGEYQSFGSLVQAAAIKAKDRPDFLGENEIFTFLDGLESLLTKRPADKVFWIKGAYAIPSSVPPRFERFISAVSSSNSVPHAPSGQPAKWLQIITAQMPGFSLGYLKEPVTSHQIGDVIEEGAGTVVGSWRRLITANEAVVMAARLRAGLTLPAAEGTPSRDPPTDRPAMAGKLVFDSQDVFVERGYVFSLQTARNLQDHLQRVRTLWEGSMLRSDVLADFAEKTAKPRPAIADILQMVDAKSLPRLPKTLPTWSRKPIIELSPDETKEAIRFVSAYTNGADLLVGRISRSISSGDCSLFYASEGNLGLDDF